MCFHRQAQRMLILILILLISALLYRTQQHEETPTPKVAILSMTTKETNYDWMAISNKQEYASRHDYDLIWSFSSPVSGSPKVWDKIYMIRDAFQATALPGSRRKKYKWVWMLDYDTLITNPMMRVEEVIKRSLVFAEKEGKRRDDVDLILTRDCEHLNAGSMFFRVSSSSWMLDFLEKWKSGMKPDHPDLTEQDVLSVMLQHNVLKTADRGIVVPQTYFNAYPEELNQCRDERDPRSWEEGMFLIHFPGAKWWFKWEEDPVGRLMRKYYQKSFPERSLV